MIQKILVALDGSVPAGRALDLATDLAKAFAAELVAMHVVSDKPLREGERRLAEAEYQADVREALGGSGLLTGTALTQASVEGLIKTSRDVALIMHTAVGRKILDRAEAEAKGKGVASVKTLLMDGDPAAAVVGTADRERPDLLIMGSRGLGEMQGLFMGSVSQKVSHAAACSVVIVK
ncbi:MAG TPA: universal stress protein [Candidatus Acidoferrum sp.]|nr:universal stress protein [Candidatus Acidoferrum sp.]